MSSVDNCAHQLLAKMMANMDICQQKMYGHNVIKRHCDTCSMYCDERSNTYLDSIRSQSALMLVRQQDVA